MLTLRGWKYNSDRCQKSIRRWAFVRESCNYTKLESVAFTVMIKQLLDKAAKYYAVVICDQSMF